jgi:ribose transport system substrate-binding protein
MRRTLLALACLAMLPGCQKQEKKVIAVIPKGTSHLFWLSVQAGALSAGKEFGVDVQWNGPASETEYPRQIQIMDSFISRRVDGAAAAGIPVTVFDSGLDSDNFMTFLATDNLEAGRMAARSLGRMLDGKGKVAMVMHAPGSASTMDRERGFEEAMKAEFPGIRIVASQFGLSDRSKAMAVTENILTAHPDLNGVFASSEPSSMGASLALKARGLGGKVKQVAFDSSDAMIEDLKAGVISAMVVQDPFRMGHDAVQTLVDKLNGKTPPKRVDLSARVVTQDDLDNPEVKRLLFPDLKKYLQP